MNRQVGDKLRKARVARSLTLEQAAQATHIRQRYLEALEEGDYSVLPSHVQVRGFLRSYASYLGLDAQELLSSLRGDEKDEDSEASAAPSPEPDTAPPPSEPPTPETEVTAFQVIGSTFQERRKMLELSLDDVEQYTRIPEHYLKIMESGQLDRFPSPVQARGMLANYATFLEMDVAAVLSYYADVLHERLSTQRAKREAPRKAPTRKITAPPWLRRVISADVIFGGILGLGMLLFAVWGIGRIMSTQTSDQPEPTAPSLVDVLAPTATSAVAEAPAVDSVEQTGENVTISPQDTLATATITPPPEGSTGIQLQIVASQRAWMRVTADGEVVFEGRVLPGSVHQFSGDDSVELLTGNAAALQVFLNGADLGPLGIFGEVVDLVYTARGIATPSPTPSPTIDPNLALTPSPTASSTPSPTAEETASPTP